MPSAAKHAFVTGATGFLGRNLVEQLAERGWKITAAYRDPARFEALGQWDVAGAKCDLLDLEGLTEAMPEGADAVFHMAADLTMWTRHGSRQLRTNVDGTRNAVAAAERRGARKFVFTSSWNAWGYRAGDPPLSEDMPQRGNESPVLYDRTKLAAETIVKQAAAEGLPAVVLNPCHIIGRYDSHNWARMFRMVHERRLPGIPPGSGVFCHAGAVAAAHIAAAETEGAAGNYLLPGPAASYAEVIGLIGRMTGRSVPKRAIPAWLFRAAAHVRNAVGNLRGREPDLTPQAAHIVLANARVSSERAEKELGYRSPGLEFMVQDCYDWMKRSGVLKD
ncbi:MAG: NAD-dependent epimerase/dehydratase family protein [Rhodospirillaceae bacterium]|nr:NAD-dependent epimerase/dehydratase family protein [Rhodospirillaceae bacterium]